ncbi:hypothetical protein SAMN05216548_106165 [Faunimonas pinastri]|uniref:DUF985 domain-containing protein n=1 Tax=Faunimonas pinastri TaxID=1855383 RepID=A0A1H9HUB8_9HYPH|nr:cupin domain-containing protein [Faunimonas pinastri]SEQ65911.1 hypothetical protein SAMN05216548_106165 [Faunimonas pinastri]
MDGLPERPLSAREVIRLLDLEPHPEGGAYRQTFQDENGPDGRPRSTAIHYLLAEGQVSAWHRIDAVEIWHFHAGAPLALSLAGGDDAHAERHMLGPDLRLGERPQVIVPRRHWQSAVSTGEWTLVSCTVAPGFRFEGFELAPDGWEPGMGDPGRFAPAEA